jgi:hypothetical protein
MYDLSEKNAVQVWRDDSKVLLIVFSGIFPIAGVAPFDFIRETPYLRSNLLYLSDFYRSGYKKGLSENLPALETVIQWITEKIDRQSIEEVAVVGASSGALPGLVCAAQLGVRKAWAFGPRPPADNLFKPMSEKGPAIVGMHYYRRRIMGQFARATRKPASDWFRTKDVDWDLVERQAAFLSQYTPAAGESERSYVVYYVESNKVDAAVTAHLSDCPGIRTVNIDPPLDRCGDWIYQPGWDHSVIQVMRLGHGLTHYMSEN